jgi:uncharacterized protein YecT (DUF1311 family)
VKICGITIVALLLAAGAARADEKINCKSGDLNQMELDQCAGRDFTAADAKLNTLYKVMMSKYDAANGALLKASERAWIAYRDAQCDFATNGTAGGTINSMEDTICRTGKTNDRIKELNAQLHCAEGNLDCNAPN